ncbi:MAG: hypothetical protein PHY93_11370 [Bacteriovorax sp.]|nr:hypothetical protein [Bacteriovorax sp.]
MKKLMLSAIVTMFMSMATQAADTLIPAWACNLNFKGQAQGFQVILGKFDANAVGTLTCVSPFAEVKKIPVRINMSTKILAPRIALGKFDIYGEAAQIALFSNEPEDLLGSYIVAVGQGALVAGAGVMTAVHATIPHLTMQVSVQFVRGFGLNVGVTKMTLEEIK